ncbi:DNA methyltransferase [Chloroflexota bacterium]
MCPYFTMFPLEFPYKILKSKAKQGEWVLDPFCGRGTTSFASRLLGLPSFNIDTNPMAVALTKSKLAQTTPLKIVSKAKQLLETFGNPREIPEGEFWNWAFDVDTLKQLAGIREGMLCSPETDTIQGLRGVILGALHGPINKTQSTYFSNQCMRTFSPKPRYAVSWWKNKGIKPPKIDLIKIIELRANWYFSKDLPEVKSIVCKSDSRQEDTYEKIPLGVKFNWIITSPPYYGMDTYLSDQWLRNWFLGGEPTVNYSRGEQISHRSIDDFASDLKEVWIKISRNIAPEAKMIIRFGSINHHPENPKTLLLNSLLETGWQIQTIKSAGKASDGRRQSTYFNSRGKNDREEFDVWARFCS